MDYVAVGGYAATGLALSWGFLERFKKETANKQKQTAADAHEIIKVKDELIKVAQESRETWKGKYETEHQEYLDYRIKAHDQINKANEIVLKATEDVAELRAKTDLTPILQHLEQQNEVNGKILDSLVKIHTTQDLLISRLLSVKPLTETIP